MPHRRGNPAGKRLDDLAKVADRESDPAPIQVERHLSAVGACAERALGHLGEPEVAEDLGGFGGSEELGKVQPRYGRVAGQPASWRRGASGAALSAGRQGCTAARRKAHHFRNGTPSCPVGVTFPASWGWHVHSMDLTTEL